MINILNKSDVRKIQFTIAINFTSSKGIGKEGAVHSRSDIIEMMTYDKADAVIEEISESLLDIKLGWKR